MEDLNRVKNFFLVTLLTLLQCCSSNGGNKIQDPYDISPRPFFIYGNYSSNLDFVELKKYKKGSKFNDLVYSETIRPKNVHYSLKENRTTFDIEEIDYKSDFRLIFEFGIDKCNTHEFSNINIYESPGGDFNFFVIDKYTYNGQEINQPPYNFEIIP